MGAIRLPSYGQPVVSKEFPPHEFHYPHHTELTSLLPGRDGILAHPWDNVFIQQAEGSVTDFSILYLYMFWQVTYLLVTSSSLAQEQSSTAVTQDSATSKTHTECLLLLQRCHLLSGQTLALPKRGTLLSLHSRLMQSGSIQTSQISSCQAVGFTPPDPSRTRS